MNNKNRSLQYQERSLKQLKWHLLKPKQHNPHYKGLVLIVQHITGRVDGFVVYNQNGSTNYFQLEQIKTNTGLTDASFKFTLPKGYVESRE